MFKMPSDIQLFDPGFFVVSNLIKPEIYCPRIQGYIASKELFQYFLES